MQPACPCTLCTGTHTARRCPELVDPLQEGFYSGGGANRDHGGDEDALAKKVELLITRHVPVGINKDVESTQT